MRVGLIGAGRWGKRYIHTLAQVPDIELVRLGSRNPDSAALAPEGCRISADWREVACASDLDAVIIATPPALHARMAIAALHAGNAVLVEKPLTLDPAEAEEIRKAAERAERPVMVDHTHLFSEAYRELKQRINDLGGLLHIESSAGNNGPFRSDVTPLWDWGAHDAAMILDLIGEYPKSIIAVQNRFEDRPDGLAEDVDVWMNFSNGATAHFRVSNLRHDKHRSFVAQCRRGVLMYDDLAVDKLLVYSGSGEIYKPALQGLMPLTTVIRDFYALVCSAARTCDSLELGCSCVTALHCAQQGLLRR